MLNKIKTFLGILLALMIIALFGYLLYQPAAKALGLPSCCQVKCKLSGYPAGKCMQKNEFGSGDVHLKYGPCWNPLDEHCSFPGICRCMCKRTSLEEE